MVKMRRETVQDKRSNSREAALIELHRGLTDKAAPNYDRNRMAIVRETRVYRQTVDHDAHHDEGHDLSCPLVCRTLTCRRPIHDQHLTSDWGLRPVSLVPDPTITEQQLTINQKSNLTHHRKHRDARWVLIKSTTNRKYKPIFQLLFIVQTDVLL